MPAVDVDYGVYDGPTFKTERFVAYLAANEIAWPLLECGRPLFSTDGGRP